jgi:disulfide bond formation protein DsbB
MMLHDTSNTAGADAQVEDAQREDDRFTDLLAVTSRHIALLAAYVATCGSLFFSEVLGWPPCELCWYQRICMYPLALILPIGILRRDRRLHLYVLPLALIGAPISLYHYLLIKTDLFTPPQCTGGIPCTVDYLDWFGVINIPFMALTAFLIIIVMMAAWALLPAGAPAAETTTTGTARDWSGIAVFAIIAAVLAAFAVGSVLVI